MNSTQLTVFAFAAVLLFWTVGAYNRLVRLRNTIVESFGPLHDQLRQRHLLLRQQGERLIEALAPDQSTPDWLDALAAANAQAESACAHARMRPGAAGAITSLRLAEEVLANARRRLPAGASENVAELEAQFVRIDSALDFARQRYNAAVLDYNAALAQFPTRMLAALFGFGAAGTL